MGKDRNDRRKKLIASCLLALLLIGGVAAAERLNQMDPASRGLTGTPSGVTFWRAEQEDVEIPDEEIENIHTVGDLVSYIEEHM